MSIVSETSSLWRQRTFRLYRRKGRQKVLLFYGAFTANRIKSQFGSTNQRNPHWLNTKPDPKHPGICNNRLTRTRRKDPRTPEKGMSWTEDWPSAPPKCIWCSTVLYFLCRLAGGGECRCYTRMSHEYVRDLVSEWKWIINYRYCRNLFIF